MSTQKFICFDKISFQCCIFKNNMVEYTKVLCPGGDIMQNDNENAASKKASLPETDTALQSEEQTVVKKSSPKKKSSATAKKSPAKKSTTEKGKTTSKTAATKSSASRNKSSSSKKVIEENKEETNAELIAILGKQDFEEQTDQQ